MQHKKLFSLLSLLALTSTAAYASLDTYNYTHEDSSVRVTSGSLKKCSNDAGVYTPKMSDDGITPGHSNASDGAISGLCLTSPNYTCTADIFSSRDCSGPKVGYASLSLKTKAVTSVVSTNPKYVFISENGGTKLSIKYAV